MYGITRIYKIIGRGAGHVILAVIGENRFIPRPLYTRRSVVQKQDIESNKVLEAMDGHARPNMAGLFADVAQYH